MKYIERSFTLPANTADISEELWQYRIGKITAEEFEKLTGYKPDEENQ